MAKTIKEMMQKAFWETDISDHPAKAFEQGYDIGANAVLDIINNIVQYNKGDERPWLLRGNHLYNELVKKIKELKGEEV